MAHANLGLAVPQLPQASSAIRGEDELERSPPANPSMHAPVAGRAPREAHPLTPLSQHTIEPRLSESGMQPPTQNASPQAEQSYVDALPAQSSSAAQLVYNNLVALDNVSGMEVDSQASDNDSALGDSIYG